jgi:hypothetical protein
MLEPFRNIASIAGSHKVFTIYSNIINASSNGDNLIISSIINKKFRILGLKFSCASDVTITWKNGLGGGAVIVSDAYSTALAAESFAAKGGMSDFWGPWGWFFETSVGSSLNMYLSGGVQVSGWINYIRI